MTPTYEQLMQELQKNNINFSDYDLALARENPAAGYGIMNAKIDYANATTPAGQALANSAAERWRAQYGYSGGADGSRYIPTQGMTSFSYPEMTDQYRATYDEKLQNVYDRQPFEYNPETDPLYGYYKDAYNREGQRAMQQTLAEVSSRTGGLASSYATTAAAQQNNYYAQQLADKIPDLYEMAYKQYSDEYNRNYQDAALAGDRYGMEYDRYYKDRDFAYGLYGDDLTRRQTAMNDARDRIQAYLTAGGDLANLPRDLLTASGLTEQELQQYASSLQMLGGSGRYYGGAVEPGTEDNKQLSDADLAQSAIWNYLTHGGTIKDVPKDLLERSGFTPKDLLKMAQNVNTMQTDTGTGTPYQTPSGYNADLMADVNGSIKDEKSAVNYLQGHGKMGNPLTQEQWALAKQLNPDAVTFNTYQDYLKAFVYEQMLGG